MHVGSYGLNPLWAEKEVLSGREPRLCSLTAWRCILALTNKRCDLRLLLIFSLLICKAETVITLRGTVVRIWQLTAHEGNISLALVPGSEHSHCTTVST